MRCNIGEIRMILFVITIILFAILLNSIYQVRLLKGLNERDLLSFLQDYHERERPEIGVDPSSYWYCITPFIVFVIWAVYVVIKITP